jgi:predicted nucleic acid-binding protein
LSPQPAYILDTSVAVKWFAKEGGTEQTNADRLLDALGQGECVLKAPELLFFEVANALMISHKFPSVKVMESLEFLRKLKVEVMVLRWSTFAKAVEIASTCGATIYDSYFLALAIESDSVLITADEVFLRKARHWPKIVSLRLLQLAEPNL